MSVTREGESRQHGQLDSPAGCMSLGLPADAKCGRVEQRRSCATAHGPNPANKTRVSVPFTRVGSADEAAGTPAAPRVGKKVACTSTPKSKVAIRARNLPSKCDELEKTAGDAAAGPQVVNVQSQCFSSVGEMQPEAAAKMELASTLAEAATQVVAPAMEVAVPDAACSPEHVDCAETLLTADDILGGASETMVPAEKSKQAAKNARRRQRAQAKARAEAAELNEIAAAIVSSESAARRDAGVANAGNVPPRAALRDVDGMSSAAVCAHGSVEIATATSSAAPRCAWPRPRRQRERRADDGYATISADSQPATEQQVGKSCGVDAGRGVKSLNYSDVMFSIAIARKYAPALSSGRLVVGSRSEDVSGPGSSAASGAQAMPSPGLMAFGSLSSAASRQC